MPSGRRRPALLLYAGDHDPSGEDINPDFSERRAACSTRRYESPSTPTRSTSSSAAPRPAAEEVADDPRAARFVERHGELAQFEVDALPPDVLRNLYRPRSTRCRTTTLIGRSSLVEATEPGGWSAARWPVEASKVAAIYARISKDKGHDKLGTTRQRWSCESSPPNAAGSCDREYVDDDISASKGEGTPGVRAAPVGRRRWRHRHSAGDRGDSARPPHGRPRPSRQKWCPRPTRAFTPSPRRPHRPVDVRRTTPGPRYGRRRSTRGEDRC